MCVFLLCGSSVYLLCGAFFMGSMNLLHWSLCAVVLPNNGCTTTVTYLVSSPGHSFLASLLLLVGYN